jgi:ribosome recycling factor
MNVMITENNIQSFKSPIEEEMEKVITHFDRELAKIRTGHAHTSMVEDIFVSCYGQPPVPLKTMAALAAPDRRLITIQPWDTSIINDIEKGLIASDIGVTPINDGKIIRLSLPEVSSERREELTRLLGKRLEEAKVSIRNVRKDFNNLVRDAKKNKDISEDFSNRLSDVLQDITNIYIKKAEERATKKEHSLRSLG